MHTHTEKHTHTDTHTHTTHTLNTFLQDLMPMRVPRRQHGRGGGGGGGGGGFMDQVGKEANKAMAKEAVKMGMGMLF